MIGDYGQALKNFDLTGVNYIYVDRTNAPDIYVTHVYVDGTEIANGDSLAYAGAHDVKMKTIAAGSGCSSLGALTTSYYNLNAYNNTSIPTYPVNGSLFYIPLPATTYTINFTWIEGKPPYNFVVGFAVAGVYNFEIINTSLSSNYSVQTFNLNVNQSYYWKVRDSAGGSYGSWSNISTFNLIQTPVQGQLNITAFDEQNWNTRIMTFSAQVYNNTAMLNKSTTNGWVNFSANEVSASPYFIRIVPNSTYASRSVLATSPTNVSVWIPSTVNTIDTVAFHLLDYSGAFPWDTSYLSITKNNTIMHSSYFDSDANVIVNLIRGDSYGIVVTNGNNVYNKGNYISSASAPFDVVIMNIGVNTTERNPFVYNVSWSSSDITLQWEDVGSVLSSLNYTIYQSSNLTQVHNLVTSVSSGTSVYTVTNTSTIYYVYVAALTTGGWRNQSYVVDYRAGHSATEGESSTLYTWSYGSVTMPSWVKNAFAVIALCILAGSFGALHRSEGGIIVSIMSLFFWKWTWLTAFGASAGFLGGLLLFAILYALDTKRKGVYA